MRPAQIPGPDLPEDATRGCHGTGMDPLEGQEKLSPGLGQIHSGGPLVGMLHQGLGELDLEAGGEEP